MAPTLGPDPLTISPTLPSLSPHNETIPYHQDCDTSHNSEFLILQTVLLSHLDSTSHVSTHSMVTHSNCAALGIYSCWAPSCPSSPKMFFFSLRALNYHCAQTHPDPRPPPPAPNICHQTPTIALLIHIYLSPHINNRWEQGLNFINSVYHHEPPDFWTTWRHLICSWSLSAFSNLQASII